MPRCPDCITSDGITQTYRYFDHISQNGPDRRTKRRNCSDLSRLTLDFDSSVQSTKAYAEGTAVGFNKRKEPIQLNYFEPVDFDYTVIVTSKTEFVESVILFHNYRG